MTAPKFLISTVSALMVVGGIGLAYAQTTPDSPTPTPAPMQAPNEQAPGSTTHPAVQEPSEQAPAPMGQAADTMTTPSASDSTELPPQADRN